MLTTAKVFLFGLLCVRHGTASRENPSERAGYESKRQTPANAVPAGQAPANAIPAGEATILNATITNYQACGSVPGGCGFAASGTSGTGAFSAYLQTNNAYCGTCWKFLSAVTIAGSDADHTFKPVELTQPLVVMISNTCGRDDSVDEIPPQVGNGVGLCNQNATFPVSKYGADTDLDLCSDTDAYTLWHQMSGGGTGVATIQKVPCEGNWPGTVDHIAPWANYKSGPGLAPLPAGGAPAGGTK